MRGNAEDIMQGGLPGCLSFNYDNLFVAPCSRRSPRLCENLPREAPAARLHGRGGPVLG